MFKKEINKEKLVLVKINQIDFNPYQIRRKVNDNQLSELKESIIHTGILQSITVKKSKNNRYQLVSGERRLYAIKQTGMSEVYVKVVKVNERDLALNAFIENIHIKPYHIIEKAEGVQLLVNKLKISENELAKKTGFTRCTIHYLLLIADLPYNTKKQLYQHHDAEIWAMALIKIKDQQMQTQIMDTAIKNKFNTEQFLNLTKQVRNKINIITQDGPRIIKNIATNQVFVNSVESLVREVKQCGFDTEMVRTETEKQTKVLITISKVAIKQKIC